MDELRLRHMTPEFRAYAGADALDALRRELDRAHVERAVIFCGPSMLRHGAALNRVEDSLGDRLVGRFDGVRPHSPLAAVESGRRILDELEADAVVVVGGGSATVTARAASILAAENADIRDLCTRRGADGRLVSPRLSAPKLPQWIVPTTPTTAYAKAGSAVRVPETGERLALFDPATRARGVYLDPVVALTAPASLVWSATLNAFAMAVDGMQADCDDPLADAALTHALRLVWEWLPRLHAEPVSPEPRLRLMLAALLSGQGTDATGMGLTQALSHAIGPRSTVANGVIEAMLLPHTITFNAPVTLSRLGSVAHALLGQEGSAASAAERAIDAVVELQCQAGIPRHLREVGVAREHIDQIVDHVLDDWTIANVPRRVDRHDLDALLQSVW